MTNQIPAGCPLFAANGRRTATAAVPKFNQMRAASLRHMVLHFDPYARYWQRRLRWRLRLRLRRDPLTGVGRWQGMQAVLDRCRGSLLLIDGDHQEQFNNYRDRKPRTLAGKSCDRHNSWSWRWPSVGAAHSKLSRSNQTLDPFRLACVCIALALVRSIVAASGVRLSGGYALVALVQPSLPLVQLAVASVHCGLAEQCTLVLAPRLGRHKPRGLEHHRDHLLARPRAGIVQLSFDGQLGAIRP
jgi:hypothetical protein